MATQRQVGEIVQVSVSKGGVPKKAVEHAHLDYAGLQGDKHNVRVGHGGPDRAVCLLAMEIVDRLRAEGHDVYPGALGENLTIRGLDWTKIAPGDRLRIGDALIEVSQFTTPCKNIAWAFKNRDFTRVLHSKNPGEARVYARVLEPGDLAPGLAVEHLPSPTVSASVSTPRRPGAASGPG